MQIRWMIRRDFREVLQIEKQCFASRRWTEEDFLLALRQRTCIGMVADDGVAPVPGGRGDTIGENILGFMAYDLRPDRLVVLNFAVSPAHQRQGVGTALINKLKAKLSSVRRNVIELQVIEDNLAAQLFFQSCWFEVTAIHRRPYEDSDRDGYTMEYLLPDREREQRVTHSLVQAHAH